MLIGGSAGIGLETARAARAAGADVEPIGCVVGLWDVLTLTVRTMVNMALTGASHDIDGGRQLVEQLPGWADFPNITGA